MFVLLRNWFRDDNCVGNFVWGCIISIEIAVRHTNNCSSFGKLFHPHVVDNQQIGAEIAGQQSFLICYGPNCGRMCDRIVTVEI